ncbi:hypothetical protein DY000_02009810 [Brassica cretica]|uniref:Uncharacterized protein n=1 Tax=Brassica cretica TaxID=69181 RepID=A0ABQ7C9U6_BRACR|nr:hypothetical protein DY000_02009810 [Brassica cretica]
MLRFGERRFCGDFECDGDLSFDDGFGESTGGSKPSGEKEKDLEVSQEEFREEGRKENKEESNGNQEESSMSNWKLVSPEKVGRSPLGNVAEVLISASKFAVLNIDEVEEVEEGEKMIILRVIWRII